MAGGTSADYRRRPEGSDASAGSGSGRGGAKSGKRWKPLRVLRVAAGFLLLLLGVFGLFLPILQGVLMILAGLAVLGRDVPWSRAITGRLASFMRRRGSRRAVRERGHIAGQSSDCQAGKR